VADIPEPKIEWHRYRRHVYRCRCCEQTCQAAGTWNSRALISALEPAC
jgi:hypothetical protein